MCAPHLASNNEQPRSNRGASLMPEEQGPKPFAAWGLPGNTGLSDYARSYFVARPVPCFMIAFRLSRDSCADSVRARLSPVCFSISLRDIIRPPDKALRTWASKTKTICIRLRTRRKRFLSYLRTVIGYKFHVHTTINQTHSVFVRQCVRIVQVLNSPAKAQTQRVHLGADGVERCDVFTLGV